MTGNKISMGFVQKFGLKYFAFLLHVAIYVGTFQLTQSMEVVLVMIVLLPRIGKFLPPDDQLKSDNSSQYNKNYYHMLAPAGCVFAAFGLFYYTWTNYQEFSSTYQSLCSCIMALSLAAAGSIDASHELIHRNQFWLRAIGFIGLIPYQFTTYPMEHLYMHHKLVGTPDDAVTAPKNMSIYRYYLRTVFSTYVQTFKQSKTFFAFCLALNWSYLFTLYHFALKQYSQDSLQALRKTAFFLCVAMFSMFLMESIQYIQHYGLVYRKNNIEKPVLQISSWNTTVNPLYNWITFRFQRHSDHHLNAYKVYSSLQLNEKMPQFPFSFPEAMAACWMPNIWYKIADPLVDKVLNHEKLTSEDLSTSVYWTNVANSILGSVIMVNAYIGYSY